MAYLRKNSMNLDADFFFLVVASVLMSRRICNISHFGWLLEDLVGLLMYLS